MTREELKAHCERQIQQFERVEKIMPVTPNDWKRYEEHKLILELLEQESRKGHWINKHRFFDPDSCSAECSSCHKRSNGYMYDNGLTLVSTYYDFCPKCGSDNREVVEDRE